MCELFGTPVTQAVLDGHSTNHNCQFFDHVRMVRMKHTDARGPVYARAHQIDVIEEGDEFCTVACKCRVARFSCEKSVQLTKYFANNLGQVSCKQ